MKLIYEPLEDGDHQWTLKEGGIIVVRNVKWIRRGRVCETDTRILFDDDILASGPLEFSDDRAQRRFAKAAASRNSGNSQVWSDALLSIWTALEDFHRNNPPELTALRVTP